MWRHGRGRLGRRAWRVAACVLVVGASCSAPAAQEGMRGTPFEEPLPAPALRLADTEGNSFDLRRQAPGVVTLVFFGYTSCPDVCPIQMATLAAAYRELEPEVKNGIRVVFVSTDPDRDTPEVLRAWLDGFDRSFVGLRGPLGEINEALADLLLPGVVVLPAGDGSEAPLVGHPSAIVAFGKDGLARYRYPFGTRSADWLHDLPRLVQGP